MANILVTGGAGYIGSHAVKALCNAGNEVFVIDNLSKGHKKAVDERATFMQMELSDETSLEIIFAQNKFDAVLHFTGFIEVGESMIEPAKYMENNLMNGMKLLDAMRKYGVNKIIFSSTAAVYGNPKEVPIKEDADLLPTNMYGFSKLMFEQLLSKYDQFWDIKSVCLRYFNACGADSSGKIGQDYVPDTHIVPRVLKSMLGIYDSIQIYGTDYPTKDGTCVRDYIHVTDLIDAHLLALDYLFKGGKSEIFNLGNGSGFSVKEVIDSVESMVKQKVNVKEAPRREGDPAVLIADATKAKEVLKWVPQHSSLDEIIKTAWDWHKANPNGYDAMP
jgi:UDP-glucose 4-epimerase